MFSSSAAVLTPLAPSIRVFEFRSDRNSQMVDMDKIVSLSKRRGFIFQSSELDSGDRGLSWNYAKP